MNLAELPAAGIYLSLIGFIINGSIQDEPKEKDGEILANKQPFQ